MQETGMEPRKILNYVWMSLFIMAALIIGIETIINYLLYFYAPDILKTDWFVWALTAFGMICVGLPSFYFTARRIPDYIPEEKKRLSFTQFLYLFFICMAALYVSNLAGSGINFLVESIKGSKLSNPLADVVFNTNFFLTFLYGVIIAPVIEELIFRKLVLNKLRSLGDLTAILVSGIAFGLFHMNLSQIFYAASLGFIFAYIVIQTNTIKYTIILHMIINFIGIMMPYVMIESGNLYVAFLMNIWVLASISIGITFFFLAIKKIKFNKATIEIGNRKGMIINLGALLFAILCIVRMIMTAFYS